MSMYDQLVKREKKKHPKQTKPKRAKNAAAVALGRMGGQAKMAAMSPVERSKLAVRGAEARWLREKELA